MMFCKIFIGACLSLVAISGQAQIITLDTSFRGFGMFQIGDPIEKFSGTLRLGRGQDSLNRHQTEYFYATSMPQPVLFADFAMSFYSFMIGFTEAGNLNALYFVQFYGAHKNVQPAARCKPDFRRLHEVVSAQLHSPGKFKTYYNKGNTTDIGYEWSNDSLILKINLDTRKDRDGGNIGVSLYRKQ